jgi:hypothetical protein
MVSTRSQRSADENIAGESLHHDEEGATNGGDDSNVGVFVDLGSELLKMSTRSAATASFVTRWTSHFQVDPIVCAEAWQLLQANEVDGINDNG